MRRILPLALCIVAMLAGCTTASKDARIDDQVDGQTQGYILFSVTPNTDIGRLDFQRFDSAKGLSTGASANQLFGFWATDRYRLLQIKPGDWAITEIVSVRRDSRSYPSTTYTCKSRGEAEVSNLQPSANDPMAASSADWAMPIPAKVPWLKVEPGKIHFIGDFRLQALPCANRIAAADIAAANRFLKEKYPFMPPVDRLTRLEPYTPPSKAP